MLLDRGGTFGLDPEGRGGFGRQRPVCEAVDQFHVQGMVDERMAMASTGDRKM